jgi:phosphate transport system protein
MAIASPTNLTLAQAEAGTLLAFDMALEQLQRSLDLMTGEHAEGDRVMSAGAMALAEQHRLVSDAILTVLSAGALASSDLRHMAVLLHVLDALERIEDECGEIAELTRLPAPEAATFRLSRVSLAEMGELVRTQAWLAREMLRTRNARLTEPFLRGRIEVARHGRRLLKRTVVEGNGASAGAPAVIGVANCLETISDSASEVAEQMVFLLTGLFREVSDNCSPSAAAEAFLA